MSAPKKRLKLKIRIESDPTQLFDALVNPIKLAIWFCNKAEVNLKLRGSIKMRGDNCIATTFPEKEIHGTIRELEPNKMIKFTWPISGVESEVTFEVYDHGRHCDLVLTHARVPENSLIMDGWITYLYNLQHFILYQRPAYRLDYHNLDRGTIKRELFIEELPFVVFRALTDQRDLRIWFGKEAECEPIVGGKYLSGWHDKEGNPQGPRTIKEIVENKKLVYDWVFPGDEGQVGDLVTWELLRIGEKTRVNLRHTGFGPDRYNKDYTQGWHAYMLVLKDFCESGGRISYQVLDGDWTV